MRATAAEQLARDRGSAATSVSNPYDVVLEAHWPGLVRLAAMLLGDRDHAEDVVQEAAIACLSRVDRLRDPDAALAYLRRAVVNGSRSEIRRRKVSSRHWLETFGHIQEAPPAHDDVLASLQRDALVDAIRQLPPRQREAIVLRYYVDLSERETAATMRISVGSVKSACSRGLTSLETILGENL